MAVEDVLRSLTDRWDDVLGRLSEADRIALIELIEQINSGGQDAEEAPRLVVRLLLRSLPQDDPLREVTRSGLRFSPGTAQPALSADLLARLADLPGLKALTPEDIWVQARRRLLRIPSISSDLLISVGQNPDQSALIRLRDDDGAIRIPRFQFDADGSPLPVVLRINQVLDVLDDPWGVADWWLSQNAWLQGPPAGLIGLVDDAVLIATATATAEG